MNSEMKHAESVAPSARRSYVEAFRQHALAALDEAARAARERKAGSPRLSSGVLDTGSAAGRIFVRPEEPVGKAKSWKEIRKTFAPEVEAEIKALVNEETARLAKERDSGKGLAALRDDDESAATMLSGKNKKLDGKV